MPTTSFVGTNVPVITQSYSSCHIIGDPDLYGLGTRVSIYVQCFFAIICQIFGRKNPLSELRKTLTVTAAAVLIGLIYQIGPDNLTILAWEVVSPVVLFSPLMAFMTEPIRQIALEAQLRKWIWSKDNVAEALVAVLGRKKAIQREIEETYEFITRMRAAKARQRRQGLSAIREYSLAKSSGKSWWPFTVARIPDTDTPNAIIEDFRSRFSRYANYDEEREGQQDHLDDLQRVKSKLDDDERALEGVQATVSRIIDQALQATLMERTTFAFICIVYAAYHVFSVWVLSRGLMQGSKAGCDVKIFLLVVPVSIYSHHVATFLLVMCCVLLLPALYILWWGIKHISLFVWRSLAAAIPVKQGDVETGVWFLSKERKQNPASAAEPQQRRLHRLNTAQDPVMDYRDVGVREMVEKLAETRKEWEFWARVIWFLVLLILLAATGSCSEMAIVLNHIDMGRGSISVSEVMAIGMTVMGLIPVVWDFTHLKEDKEKDRKNKKVVQDIEGWRGSSDQEETPNSFDGASRSSGTVLNPQRDGAQGEYVDVSLGN